MACFRTHCFLLLQILIILLHFGASSTASTADEILLKFRNSLSGAAFPTWNKEKPPCNGDVANWKGVLCSKGTVWGIQLENMGLQGTIDVDTLAELKDLRTISLMKNSFEGPLPDLKKLGALKSVFLSYNQFSGEIPVDAFKGMLSLKKVFLAQNQLTGAIPSSLTTLPRLLELRLEGNKFQGQIPDFQQKDLKSVNIANNALEGSIPARLSKMDSSLFSGNKGLCGQPLQPCPSPPEATTSKNSSNMLTIIFIAIIVLVVLAAIFVFISIIGRRKTQQPAPSMEAPAPSNFQKKAGIKDLDQMSDTASVHSGCSKKAENSKLTFVRDDRERFDLPDLLKASAQILGSGSFGSSYKAALMSGVAVVVKRFKKMNNVGREEFQEHMRRLGRLRHPNLLPLVAHYYRKEEKLLVSDYVEKGSLAVYLHGNHALGQPSLDWPARLKIIKGVAKGLAYLYKELPSLIVPHGHLKSSNVLLNESIEPLITDYGLVPVINQEHAQELMVAYKSPEYSQHGRITKKTDVWGFGILILEILTGKIPPNFVQSKGEGDLDLAVWVKSVVQEEGTTEVFDKDMGETTHGEGEMLKLLKIGLSCCEGEAEKRLDLKEALERIEEVKEKDGDHEEFYSSYGDTNSSRGLSDDFHFSMND